MRRASRWMLPVEIVIAEFAIVLGVAGGVDWSSGATIYRMLHADGQAGVWLWLMCINGGCLLSVSAFELVTGRTWDADRIRLWARVRWLNLVGIAMQVLFGLKAVAVSPMPKPPLFVGVAVALLVPVVWAWWDLGKLVLVAERRPEAMGRRFDPA